MQLFNKEDQCSLFSVVHILVVLVFFAFNRLFFTFTGDEKESGSEIGRRTRENDHPLKHPVFQQGSPAGILPS